MGWTFGGHLVVIGWLVGGRGRVVLKTFRRLERKRTQASLCAPPGHGLQGVPRVKAIHNVKERYFSKEQRKNISPCAPVVKGRNPPRWPVSPKLYPYDGAARFQARSALCCGANTPQTARDDVRKPRNTALSGRFSRPLGASEGLADGQASPAPSLLPRKREKRS